MLPCIPQSYPKLSSSARLIYVRFLPGRIITRYALCEGFDGFLQRVDVHADGDRADHLPGRRVDDRHGDLRLEGLGRLVHLDLVDEDGVGAGLIALLELDRKSTRLNSSH